MKNFFLALFFGTLLAGGGNSLYGQEAPCDCNSIQFTSIIIVENAQHSGCYTIKARISENCANESISSITMQSNQFPDCFKKHVKLTNYNTSPQIINYYDLTSVTSIVLYTKVGNYNSNYLEWEVCPTDGDVLNCPIPSSFVANFRIVLSNGLFCYFTKTVNFDFILDVKNEESKTFQIYPNPAKSFLNIQGLNNIDFDELKIVDTQGKVVYNSVTMESNFNSIISNLVNGIYSIQLFKLNTFIQSKEFIKNE